MMSRFGQDDPTTFRKENFKSKKTGQQTHFAVKVLSDFIVERGMEIDILEATKDEIANLLQDFYANIRNKSQEYYKKNTLLAIRQSINRYLKENDRFFDIITDPEFTRANDNFTSLLRKTREEGKGTVTHHEAISLEDLRMLYEHPLVFNTSTPQGLLNKTIFETILYFCRRGQENLSQLKVDEFKVDSDQKGQMYVRKLTTELTKNHQGTTNETEGSGGMMYATGTDRCPVKSFVKYLKKHNNANKQKKSMSDALSKCTYGTLQQTESRSVTIETAPYDPDIIDYLGLPDDVLVDYCQSVENIDHQISVPKQMKMIPWMNISNCTVNINYYNN
ncbi:KCTD1_15 [Mytilus edulis]|uniref:KCTD1_15 n=1 Tax=Mytilus edulis TaxID=6550 RepID=A0A8S3S1C2_MYTED|nr:KCTD1_15 [Mytilus edulis]